MDFNNINVYSCHQRHYLLESFPTLAIMDLLVPVLPFCHKQEESGWSPWNYCFLGSDNGQQSLVILKGNRRAKFKYPLLLFAWICTTDQPQCRETELKMNPVVPLNWDQHTKVLNYLKVTEQTASYNKLY
jgi:hypothetical protein